MVQEEFSSSMTSIVNMLRRKKLTKKKCLILCIGVSFFLTVYFLAWLNRSLGYSENLKYLTFYEVKENISESNINRANVGILNYKHVPNTVHYVWCGERCFEFNHYLSMKSVLKEIKPDLIIFHYEVIPIYDTFIYNTWFDELKKEFPFIYVVTAHYLVTD